MARSNRKSSSVRTALPSFKLLAACAIVATAFAWYQGALPAIPGLPKPSAQSRASTPDASPRKTAPGLPQRMAAPNSRPTSLSRTRMADRPGQPPRPQAILTGAIPKPQNPARPTSAATETRGPQRPLGDIRKPAAALPARQLPASSTPVDMKPARAPQRGDCQCPYDLMLNGELCGQRSAYLTPGWKPPLCYL